MRFNDSVLEIDVEAVAKVQGDDALHGLWNVFTKCKDSLREGRRLENITWRLWHREVFAPHGIARGGGTDQHLLPGADGHLPPAISPIEGFSSASDGEDSTLVDTVDLSPFSPDPSFSNVLNASTGRRSATRPKSPTASVSARSSSQPSARSSAISTSCSILESHHRTSSAPNRLSAGSPTPQIPIKAVNPGRSGMHIGQIISSLLPEKVNLPRSPRHPATVHSPVPNAFDVLSLPTHHTDRHNQPLSVRTAPTDVLVPPLSGSRQGPGRRPELYNAPHPTTFLPSSVSSVSSSSSCASSASSISGPSTPPSTSFVPAPIASSFGPPESESHSGSATPRAPMSPTRTRSPANSSSPRTSLYGSNPSAPATASHLNTNSNRLSISARATLTSPHPSTANPHPTVILTNPTPRPTPPSTPSQPLSPADSTPVSPSPITNLPSSNQQSSSQFLVAQRSLARSTTSGHLLSHRAMSLQRQHRATPQLLAVPFAMPALPCPEPNEQDSAGRKNENQVNPAVNDDAAAQGSQLAAVGRRSHGYVGDSSLRGGDMLQKTSAGAEDASMRGKSPEVVDTRTSTRELPSSLSSQAGERSPASASSSSDGQHRSAGLSRGNAEATQAVNTAGIGKNSSDSGARTAAARKIFFIHRSPPGDDRFVDGASSASSGALSTSLIGASIGAVSSSKSPLEPPPPPAVLRAHVPSPPSHKPVTAPIYTTPNDEANTALHSLTTPLSLTVTQPTSTASHDTVTPSQESHSEQHDSSANAPSHSNKAAPVVSTLTDGDTRKFGTSRHVSDAVREDTGGSVTPAASTAQSEERRRTPVTAEKQLQEYEFVATTECDSASSSHGCPSSPPDPTRAMGNTTAPAPDDTLEARGKKTVRALLPKSHSHASLHRKGARNATLALTRLTKAAHDGPAEKRAPSPSRPKASRQTSGGSTSQAASTTIAHTDGASLKRKTGTSASTKSATRQHSIDSTASSSARSISHSRSPGSASGTHRTFVSSPLSVGTVPAPSGEEPQIPAAPPPPVAAAPASHGAPERRPIPNRSHTLANIMRPPSDIRRSNSHAMKPQNSKSPSKRSQHRASPAKAGGSTAVAAGTRKRLLDMTSSDSGATSDDSMWSSDDEEEVEVPTKGVSKGKGRATGSAEHKEIGHLARDAALEVARQRDMFRKVPSRSYSNLGLQRQAGLLTPLLNPDPRLVPYLPANAQGINAMAQLGRPHNSAQNLGRRVPPLGSLTAMRPMAPMAPPAHTSSSPTPVLKPNKSAAEVRIAPVSVTTQVVVNPSGRPGYRLKGRPDGAEVESDDEDEDEESNPLDVDGMSRSLAQRKLEMLAGRGQKHRSQKQPAEQSALPSRKDMMREHQRQPYPSPQASYIPNESRQEEYYPYHSVELTRTPSMPLPHPYNLPAPAPPQSPRTTRRQMMANEMSESLRRNLLWERTLSRRMLGGFTRINPAPPTNGRTSGSGAQQHTGRTSVEARGPPTPLSRTKSWAADEYHATGW